jgi:hypothetical protein
LKISVITMQSVYNYGSVLQTYATQKYFEYRGYDVEFVDYYPKRMKNYGSLKQLYIDAKTFHHNPIKCIAIALVKFPSMKVLRKTFIPFLDKYINKSRTYISLEDLNYDPPKADIYCTGSDQVWNDYLEGGFDKVYFLSYAPSSSIKIAYAASFGRDDITQSELQPVKNLLDSYKAISVREESGLKIIEKVECQIKKCVLDPTLMLQKNEWEKLAQPIDTRSYILVYKLHEDSATSEIAIALGQKMGLPIIRLSMDKMKRINGGRTIVAPSVEKFISYIAHAELVITDSFHATAFSINFNVTFIAVEWKMFNDRIKTILHKVSLPERLVSNVKEAISVYEKPIDFNAVNRKLKDERKKVEKFFDEVL